MEKETFGVELELITSKFSEKMEKIKSKISNFGKITKQNFQTGMNIDISDSQKRIQDLQNEFNKVLNQEKLLEEPINVSFNNLGNIEIPTDKFRNFEVLVNSLGERTTSKLKNIEQEIVAISQDLNTVNTSKMAKLGQIFGNLKSKIESIRSSFKKTNINANDFGASIKSNFQKSIKSIKKFALSLAGIQSIWRGVSKATSAYLSQDVELSNKFQAVWVGIGSMVAPILEKLANFFVRLVSYLNVFVKALTGVDLLSRAMDKANNSTKATSKSLKTLKGQLSGLDEITNIGTSDNSDGSSSSVDTNWINAFENVNLDTEWTEKITNFGIWMKDNWQFVVGLISGTAVAIELVKLGIDGLMGLGIGLILAGLVITIKSIVDFIKDPSWNNFSNILIGLTAILAGVAIAMLAVNAANPIAWITLAIAAVVAISAIIIKKWDDIKNVFSKVGSWFGERFSEAWSAIKKAFSSVKSFFIGIWNTIKSIFTKIGSTIGDAIGGAFKTVVNAIIKFAEDKINGFIKAINVAIGVINKIPGVEIKKLSLLNIPKLDTGTNFVPNDQLAYIHKGEAVVPKKFNSNEFFDRGNTETNELLRELITTLEEKDNDIYLDGEKISQNTINRINSQKRIMGRSVV